jgi:hypothetical protein
MIIKEGYDDKPTEIKICPNGDNSGLQFWFNEKDEPDKLLYMTLDEALQLSREIKESIQKLF